jgi:hypothetical protein
MLLAFIVVVLRLFVCYMGRKHSKEKMKLSKLLTLKLSVYKAEDTSMLSIG